jgi:hypothetical protein
VLGKHRRLGRRYRWESRLQARGQIGRLADDRLLLGRARADEVPDHDQPGGDADAHLQGPTGRSL